MINIYKLHKDECEKLKELQNRTLFTPSIISSNPIKSKTITIVQTRNTILSNIGMIALSALKIASLPAAIIH
jgi:hypothetical protein